MPLTLTVTSQGVFTPPFILSPNSGKSGTVIVRVSFVALETLAVLRQIERWYREDNGVLRGNFGKVVAGHLDLAPGHEG